MGGDENRSSEESDSDGVDFLAPQCHPSVQSTITAFVNFSDAFERKTFQVPTKRAHRLNVHKLIGPSGATSEDAAERVKPGPDALRDLNRVFAKRLGHGVLAQLQRFVSLLLFRLGTLCSGIDWVRKVADNISDTLLQGQGPTRPHFSHEFACDHDPVSQKLILHLFPQTLRLFEKVEDLSGDSVLVKNLVTNRMEAKAGIWCDWLITGFPCTDFSGLNAKSRTDDNLDCISSGGLSSGAVFSCIGQILTKHRIPLFTLENVHDIVETNKTNGRCPLHALNKEVHLTGYVVHTIVLDALDYGVPQSRVRAYLTGVEIAFFAGLVGAETQTQLDNKVEEFFDELVRVVRLLRGLPMTSLNEIMLADNDPIVEGYLQEAASEPSLLESKMDAYRLSKLNRGQ